MRLVVWGAIFIFLLVIPGSFLKASCSEVREIYHHMEPYDQRQSVADIYSSSTSDMFNMLGDDKNFINITCTNVTLEHGSLDFLNMTITRPICYLCPLILTITSSVIHTLTDTAFADFHYTRIMKLSIENVQMEKIIPGAFNSLFFIVELYLADNNLKTIPDGIFNSLDQLKILDLSKNNISEINTHSLTGTNLTVLNLSKNSLKYFNSDILNEISKIDTLDLSSNKLDLSINKIKSLNNLNCYNQTSKLVSLDLSYNSLSSLGPDTFSYLYRLQYLYLQNNNISTVLHGCFSNLSSLVSLNLSSNNLVQLQDGIFDSLRSLKSLDISNNKLKSLLNTHFSIRTLKSLYLENNEITLLNSEDLSKSLPNLMTVTLDGNNFTCKNLIEIFHNFKLKLPKGNHFTTNNIYGIQCFEVDYDTNRETQMIRDFKDTSMYDYLNKGFKESNFFQYLESLQANTKSSNSTDAMYNNLNTDFEKSNFYKYLKGLQNQLEYNMEYNENISHYVNEAFKNSNIAKYLDKVQENIGSLDGYLKNNSRETGEVFLMNDSDEKIVNMNSVWLIVIVILLLLVLIMCLLSLFLFVLFKKLDNTKNRTYLTNDEVELLTS